MSCYCSVFASIFRARQLVWCYAALHYSDRVSVPTVPPSVRLSHHGTLDSSTIWSSMVTEIQLWSHGLYYHSTFGAVRWRRSVLVSALASINVVNRHWARLVLGYVTARRQVNHLGM